MVHLKIILDTGRKKADGSYPIVFRVIDVKKVLIIPSGISINEELWDVQDRRITRAHPN
ncbi:MAG: hypothetical protein JWQ25_598 [Daejeonella sp.]|nr:hypothetical protein [Daejeonella sp.]